MTWENRGKILLIDLDGTLYNDDVPVAGAGDLIRALRAGGFRYYFVTNCPAHSPEELERKLRGMDIPARAEEVISSVHCTVHYLKERGIRRAYAVGSPFLKQALAEGGVALEAEGAECVVIGHDTHITYDMLRTACICLQSSPLLIAANLDETIPHRGVRIPHTGAIAAYLQAACGVEPICVGKPEGRMLDYVRSKLGVSAQQLCIIGDNPDTDIRWGRTWGVETIRLGREDGLSADRRADHAFSTLAEIGAYLGAAPRRKEESHVL